MKTTLSRHNIDFHFEYALLILSSTQHGQELEVPKYQHGASSLVTLAQAIEDPSMKADMEEGAKLLNGLAGGSYAPTPSVQAQAGRAIQALHRVKAAFSGYDTTEP